MELPPVSVPPGSLAPLPPVVTGVVQSILAPNRYAIQVQGMLLALDASLFLSIGDKVSLRVARQTPQEVVFELARPPAPPPEAPATSAPLSPGAEELVKEFVRMRAPLDPALVERTLPLAPDATTRQVAAFLAAHGLDPSADRVQALARLASSPPPAVETAGNPPLLAPLVRALLDRTATTPLEVASTAPLLAGPPPTALEEAVSRALAESPPLRMIDHLMEAVQALPPAPPAPNEETTRLPLAIRLLSAATPGTVEETLRSLPPLSRESIRAVLQELQAMERREIESSPLLAQARQDPGGILASAARLSDFRLVNQLAQVRNDNILVLEIPVQAEGKLTHVPLRIQREPDPAGSKEPGTRFSITLDADLSRIGPIRAQLDSVGRTLRVQLRTRTPSVRTLLERGALELVDALRAQGYEATIHADLVPALDRPSIFDVFAAPDETITLDVKL